MTGRINLRNCLALALLILSGLTTEWAWGKYGGGSGTVENPYLIYTDEQMNAIGLHSEDWDKHFNLMADINLEDYTGTQFNLIGYYAGRNSPNNVPFTGAFDGNSHTISNFNYTATDMFCVGLFRLIADANAIIKNLTIIEPNIISQGDDVLACSPIVGTIYSGTISNCAVEGGQVKGIVSAASIAGQSSGIIINCRSTCNVYGDRQIGGLVGFNYSGTIDSSSFTGNITATSHYVGGVAGISNEDGVIRNSIFSGSIIATGWTGGLVGHNSDGEIYNSYATGIISSTAGVGGLVGHNSDGEIYDSYAICDVYGTATNVGGLVGDGWYGIIERCFAECSVNGQGQVGGLCGDIYHTHVINSYSIGSAVGPSNVGGLIGYYNTAYLSNCYSVTIVTGESNTGGLVGSGGGGYAKNCYWDTEQSGQTTSSLGTGKTTEQMQTMSTFTSAGWDFTTPIWTIDEGYDYPRLWWEGTILYVPGHYPTIQAAIDAAVDGDTVIIAPGTYTGDGNRDIDFLGKAITVRSQTGPENCIIDCHGTEAEPHCGFCFDNREEPNSVLSGLTITNGWAESGGGIYCRDSSPTVEDCIFTDNWAYSGGGVYNRHGGPVVTGCIFSGNSAYYDGGGMYSYDGCYGSDPIVVTNCIFSKNSAKVGGGMYNSGWCIRPIVTNCTFSGNSAENYGGGMGGKWGEWTVTNCIFWDDVPSEIDIYRDYGTAIVTYSNIQGGWPDVCSNIDSDPMFVNPDNNDFHLLPGSPCIDRGKPGSYFGLEPELDGGRINMGAYGNTPEATCKYGLTLQSYNLVSKTRVGRTEFEYVYTMTLNNNSDEDISDIIVKLLDAPDNITILDSLVSFTYIAAGQSVVSDDTFSIIVDRAVSVDATIISWRAMYNTGPGEGFDFDNLASLAEQWLGPPGIPSMDISPHPAGDGIVNLKDFVLLARYWLVFEPGASNFPPGVSITSPESGDIPLGSEQPLLIEAQAWDYDGIVEWVEFFANGDWIGADCNGSDGWTYEWQDPENGYYLLTAETIDDYGATAISEEVEINIRGIR